MIITEQYLRNLDACQPGIDLWLTEKEPDPIRCIDQLVKITKFNYATWLIAHLLTQKDADRFAIYAVEQVLPIFEAKYPDDNRLRKAIQAAKKVLKNPSKENIDAARAVLSADAASLAINTAADPVIANKIIRYGKTLLKKQMKEKNDGR